MFMARVGHSKTLSETRITYRAFFLFLMLFEVYISDFMYLTENDLEFFSFFFFFSFFLDRVSLCNAGCPGISYINQAGLKLKKTHLPLLPKC